LAIKEIPKGTRFGKLTATGQSEIRKSGNKKLSYHKCICDCGKTTWARGTSLRYGTTLSCGCYRTEQRIASIKKHNLSNSRLYRIWNDMRTRCNKEYCDHFKDYGGRGIKVCSEWDNLNDGFQNFYEWSMSNGYSNDLTIDRVDNDGDYKPGNCRWVTQYEQNRNKRNNHYLDIDGERKIITDIAKENGLHPSTLKGRLDNGCSVEDAIKIVKRNKRIINYNGKNYNPKQFSEMTGINYNTIMTRITKGYSSAEDLIILNRSAMSRKVVNQYDLIGNFIASYPSASEAARKNNCCKSGVIECCNGKKKKFKDWVFKYSDNPRIEVIIEEVEVQDE
jgi:hypothetical protein